MSRGEVNALALSIFLPCASCLQAELVLAERNQVRAREGRVRHVAVFQLGGVRTSIIGRPRPLPGRRRAHRRRLPLSVISGADNG